MTTQTFQNSIFETLISCNTLIIGPTGTGKTTLLNAYKSELELQQLPTLLLQWNFFAEPSGYNPLVQSMALPTSQAKSHCILDGFQNGKWLLEFLDTFAARNARTRFTVSVQVIRPDMDIHSEAFETLRNWFDCIIFLSPGRKLNPETGSHNTWNHNEGAAAVPPLASLNDFYGHQSAASFVSAPQNVETLLFQEPLNPFEGIALFEKGGIRTQKPFLFKMQPTHDFIHNETRVKP